MPNIFGDEEVIENVSPFGDVEVKQQAASVVSPDIIDAYKNGTLTERKKQAVDELQRRGVFQEFGPSPPGGGPVQPTAPGQIAPEQIPPVKIGPGQMALARDPEPRPLGIGESIVGAGETVVTIGTGALAEMLSGFGTIRTLLHTGDVDKAANVVKELQKVLTRAPETEAGQRELQAVGEALGPIFEPYGKGVQRVSDVVAEKYGPVAGTAVKTVIAAVPELLMLKGTRAAKKAAMSRRLGRDADALYDEAGKLLPEVERQIADMGMDIDEVKSILPEPKRIEVLKEEMVEGISAAAKRPKEKGMLDIAEEAMPSEEILQAADDLGVADLMLPSHSAQNPVYSAIEQGLKQIPGSKLAATEKRLIEKLGEKSDDIIKEFGGETDKALLSEKFRTDSRKLVEDLENKAGDLFEELNDNIPSKTIVSTDNIISSIRKRADKLGGEKHLDPLERKLLTNLSKESSPTYARLENLRRKAGAGLKGKGGKAFKDADEAALKNIYKNLAEDQLAAAKKAGYGDKYQIANALIVQRKGIEDQLIKTLGKQVEGDIAKKGRNAILDLQKGNTQLFRDLAKNIPKELGPDMRKSVFVTALNDAFTQTSRKEKMLNVPGFDDFMKGINRNSKSKELLTKEIGQDATKRLETMHKVVGGIRKAHEDAVTTGRIGAVPGMFDEVNKMTERLYGTTRAMIPLKAGVEAGITFVNTLTDAKRVPRSSYADDLLSSPKFQDILKKKASGEIDTYSKSKRAEKILEATKEFKKWKNEIPDRDLKDLAAIGALGYLTGEIIGKEE